MRRCPEDRVALKFFSGLDGIIVDKPQRFDFELVVVQYFT